MKQQYSDNTKATALVRLEVNSNNIAQTCRELAIPHETLRGWVNGRGVNPEVTDMRDYQKEKLADRLEALAHQIIDVMPGKLHEATLPQLAVALGIAVEKMELLREKASPFTPPPLSDEARKQRLWELIAIAEQRQRQNEQAQLPAASSSPDSENIPCQSGSLMPYE